MPLGFGNEKKRSSSAFIASVSQQLFSEIQNVTSSSHRSRQASNPTTAKSAATYLDLFKELWKDTIGIFSKNLINDEDVDKVKENLNQMMSLLLNELNKAVLSHEADGSTANKPTRNNQRQLYGPVWEFFFKHNIFEVIFLWSLSYPEYLYDLKYEQLCHYENLIGHLQTTEQTDLLFSSQIHQPLFSLLNHSASHNSPLIENHMIAILNQLCVCICKNDKLLSIFFDPSSTSTTSSSNSDFVYGSNKSHFDLTTSTPASSTFYSYDRQQGPAKFLIFSLLIPYIHKEGSLGNSCGSLTYGQQARDALLLIMQLSARNPSLAKYIVDNTDFCPILATGLSGLYSDLPPKLTARENFDEIRYLQEADIVNIPSLNKFINSLEFCNNVIQISHSLISNQLLQYVYHGFLVPVLAPALTQDTDLYPSDLAKLEEYTNCIDEIVTATVYLDLFLRRINEINLQRLFLKFILYFKLTEKSTLLGTFIGRINSNSKLTLTTLMLFYSMIDLNSEDVIYKLILVHLMPCKHLMKSQIATLKETSFEINGLNAQAFLSLSTNYMNFDGGNHTNASNNRSLVSLSSPSTEPTPIADWIHTVFDNKEVLTLLSYIDSMRFNFIDYLKDAKSGIKSTTSRTARWSHKYDALVNLTSSQNAEETTEKEATIFRKRPVNRPALDLEFEPEEFLLHLNLSATAMDMGEPELASKSRRSTMNLSNGTESDHNKFGEDSQELAKETTGRDATSSRKKEAKLTKKSDKQKKPKSSSKKSTGNDFYVLSFDNELSESSSSEDESLSSSVTSSNPSLGDQTPEKPRKESIDKQQLVLSSKSGDLNQANRSKLVDYLFSDNLDGSLNSFFDALDSYFVQNSTTQVTTGLEIQKSHGDKSSNEINKICDEIVNIYNECFIVRSVPKPTRLSSTNVLDESSDKENFDGVRARPQKSSQKKTTSNYTINDQTEDDNQHDAQETDIGPFLCAIFNRLENFLCNSLQINFLITGLLARLAYYPQLLVRSFLLNQRIVMQPNIKSLMQVLSTVKAKIDSCSQTYDNYNLIYLKAKLNLVKRLLDLRSKNLSSNREPSGPVQTPLALTSPTSSSNVQINLNPPKKKFTVDRILNIFFKPPSNEQQAQPSPGNVQYKNNSLNSSQITNNLDNSSSTQSSSTNDESMDASRQTIIYPKSPAFDKLFTPGLELDFNEIKNRFNGTRSKTTGGNQLAGPEKSYEDFVQLEVDWEDHNTRNIAYSTVIYDEFIKELAAICQEHCVLTQE